MMNSTFEELLNQSGSVPEVSDATARVMHAFRLFDFQHTRAIAISAIELNMNPIDFRALVSIVEEQPCRPSDLSMLLHLTSGSITTLIDRLVAAQFITRSPDPNDRRQIYLQLTDDGTSAMLRFARRYMQAFQASVEPQDADAVSEFFDSVSGRIAANFC